MKAVALYEMGPDMMTRVPVHLAAHRERWREFAARGELLMIGPFANAQEDGAMATSPPARRPRNSCAATRSSLTE